MPLSTTISLRRAGSPREWDENGDSIDRIAPVVLDDQ